jgi:hypothetical protein
VDFRNHNDGVDSFVQECPRMESGPSPTDDQVSGGGVGAEITSEFRIRVWAETEPEHFHASWLALAIVGSH